MHYRSAFRHIAVKVKNNKVSVKILTCHTWSFSLGRMSMGWVFIQHKLLSISVCQALCQMIRDLEALEG